MTFPGIDADIDALAAIAEEDGKMRSNEAEMAMDLQAIVDFSLKRSKFKTGEAVFPEEDEEKEK